MNKELSPSVQHTLKSEFIVEGVGLHTGVKCTMTVKPASAGFGFKFQRVDVPNQPIIKADVDLVVDTSRGTTLEQNGVRVATVEHILSALVGMSVDNALIQLTGEEIPIMDGSASAFVNEIESTISCLQITGPQKSLGRHNPCLSNELHSHPLSRRLGQLRS